MTDQRNWQSVRTVLEALILGGIAWTGNNLVTMKVQLATMQGQLAIVSAQLADVSGMKAKVEILDTRLSRAEQDLADTRKRLGQ